LTRDKAAADDALNSIFSTTEEEWQAILAVIVLSKRLGLKVIETPLFFEEQGDLNYQGNFTEISLADPHNLNSLSFPEKILAKRLPTSGLWIRTSAGEGWKWSTGKLFVLEYLSDDGQTVLHMPIAMSSPTTFIVPTINAWRILWKKHEDLLPWIKKFVPGETVDSDFTTVKALQETSKQHIPLLRAWLNSYMEFLKDKVKEGYVNEADRVDVAKLYENGSYLQNFYAALDDGTQETAPLPINLPSDWTGDDRAGDDRAGDDRAAATKTHIRNTLGISSLASLRSKDVFDSRSDVKLSGSESKTLYIDCKSTNINGMEPKDVLVLSGRTLDWVRREHSAGRTAWFDEMRKQGYNFIFSDEVFLPKAVFVRLDESDLSQLYKNHGGCSLDTIADAVDEKVIDKGSNYLNYVPMPLTDDGLQLYKEYNATYKFELAEGFNSLNITLDLPLTDRNGSSYTQNLIQRYEEKGDFNLIRIRNFGQGVMADCGIWPRGNIQLDGEGVWKNYYVFNYYNNDSKNGPISYYFEPSKYVELYDKETSQTERYSRKVSIYSLDNYPTELKLKDSKGDFVGYVPLKANEIKINNNNESYAAGLDFGTSSTVIYRKIGTEGSISRFYVVGNGAGLGSSSAWYYPCNDASRDQEFDSFVSYFVPHNNSKEPIGSPFQSLLHDFRTDNTDRNTRYDLFDARLFHKMQAPDHRNPNAVDAVQVIGEVYSNLKWSEDPTMENRLEAIFLRIAKMIALDAVLNGCNNLDITATYPGAMVGADSYLNKLETQFKTVVKDCINDSFLSFNSQNDGKLKKLTEGIASAQFFYTQYTGNNTIHDGAISGEINRESAKYACIIDIGGGTTDYFIWGEQSNETKVASQSSLKFGARNMFVELLWEDIKTNSSKPKDSILQKIIDSPTYKVYGQTPFYAVLDGYDKSDDWIYKEVKVLSDLSKTSSGTGKGKFIASLETMLAIPVKAADGTIIGSIGDILPQIALKVNDNDGRLKKFLTLLALGAAATVYYAGMLARVNRVDKNTLHLYFSGNGSKLLNWLLTLQGTEPMTKFFSTIFNSALYKDAIPGDQTNKVEVKFDNYDSSGKWNKHEAALGVFGSEINVNADVVKNYTLAGEDFKMSNDGKSYESVKAITNIYDSDDPNEINRDHYLVDRSSGEQPKSRNVRPGNNGIGTGELSNLDGTYKAEESSGFSLAQYVTFRDGTVTISAFGLDISGDYEIKNDYLIVTYSLFGFSYSHEFEFSRSFDSVTIDGVTFVK